MFANSSHIAKIGSMKNGYPSAVVSAKNLLDQVAKKLLAESCFKSQWQVSVHYFPAPPPQAQSVTIHVFRPNWYNEDRQGIHFEAHLGNKELAKKQIPLMVHIFHSATIPATRIKRIKVTKPFVDANRRLIESWPGYVFRVGCYGTQPFTRIIDFSGEKDFVNLLSAELSRLCEILGPQIDLALANALAEG